MDIEKFIKTVLVLVQKYRIKEVIIQPDSFFDETTCFMNVAIMGTKKENQNERK